MLMCTLFEGGGPEKAHVLSIHLNVDSYGQPLIYCIINYYEWCVRWGGGWKFVYLIKLSNGL